MKFTSHHSLRAGLLMGTALVLSAPALAQSPDVSDDEERREETVTVYGTSNPIPVFDYPGQVSVITRDDLDTFAPSTVSDALRDVPGLDFAGGPRRTGELPSIRGLSGQNVLILVDGARQSFTSAHDGRFFLDPELIGKAEVVKGPASALYGSGAVGGVLAFESVDAADFLAEDQTMGARIRLGYQSVNEETLATLSGFTRQGKFDGVASIGLRQSGDIELGSGASLPSDDDIQSALLKGSYALTDALNLEASWQRFDNTAIEPNNGQGTAGTGDTVLDRDVEKDIVTDTYRAAITFNPASNNWIDTTLTAYQTDSKVDEFDQTVPRTISRDIETTGFSVRNASRFTLGQSENTITIGVDWYEDEQVGTDDQTVTGTRNGVPDGMSEFTGVFAQLESVIATQFGELLIVPGVRFDEFESSSSVSVGQTNSDDAVSPRFAASFEPAGATWFRAFGSYSEGFRAPSVNELYLDGVHFSVPHPILFNPARGSFVFVNNNFIPNPDLVPEKTETVEFGAGIDFRDVWTSRDRLQGKLSYFETDAQDLINLSVDFAYDPTCFAPPAFQPCTAGTTNSANVDSAQIEGWEGELRYDSERFFSQATLSIIEGTDNSDGSDLGSLTADRLALNFGVKMPEWNSRIGSRIQIADDFERREADGAGGFTIAEQRDGYVVVDLYASWSPSFAENVRLDVGIDNIFEHDYDRVFEGVSEPGRNFKAALSWQFGV
ncbi:TonB-dependent hemoglobin/transferrin/lactoferrin family receptor [Henriciella marina]|uniref:TonB-dependent hemoglobin/transferrin/lactoferrin family receptor n=1 Tax=Henriciella marina TaxID=453851 RepID=UPI00037F188B|nr:TonB-dependent hemoglobin/transferrin/lactoferrin family receptor [Henriciella marina]